MKIFTAMILLVALLSTPPRTSATPPALVPIVVFLESVVATLGARLVNHFFDRVTGEPNLREIRAELRALRAEIASRAIPIGDNFLDEAIEEIGPGTTRQEFSDKIIKPLRLLAESYRRLDQRMSVIERSDANQEQRLAEHDRQIQEEVPVGSLLLADFASNCR